MFFLVTQTLLFIGLAFLFGVGIGWLIWGRLQEATVEYTSAAASQPAAGSVSVLSDSLLKTQRELDFCQRSLAEAEERLRIMESQKSTKKKKSKAASSNSFQHTINNRVSGDADDLKLIYGIGPIIERRLAEIDITTYRQIASMTEEDIVRVGSYINYYPGRIERDGWLERARELHREKYGEDI